MSAADFRSKFLADTVATASPAKLVVMLYDRLALDLEHGEQHLRAGRNAEANNALVHAQEIILELSATLDVETWDGARQLLSLYAFLLSELVAANLAHDADRVGGCRELIDSLREAWQEAAQTLSSAAAQPPRAVESGLGDLGVA